MFNKYMSHDVVHFDFLVKVVGDPEEAGDYVEQGHQFETDLVGRIWKGKEYEDLKLKERILQQIRCDTE